MLKKEIKSLTGLRGVAACWVMLGHYHDQYTATNGTDRVFLHSIIAVDMFFILSGFVLAMTYGRRPGASGSAYCSFVWRRIARLVPLNTVTTLICFAYIRTGTSYIGDPASGSLAGLAANLLMVQDWCFITSINFAAWSLSAEWGSNLLYPLFARLGLQTRRSSLLLVTAATALLLIATRLLMDEPTHGVFPDWSLLLGPGHADWVVIPPGLVRCFFGFLLGVCCYQLAATMRMPVLVQRFAPDLLLVAVVLGEVFNLFADWAYILMYAGLILTLSYERSLTGRLLSIRPIHWLGLVSFTIYLVHLPLSPLLFAMGDYTAQHGVPHSWAVSGAVTAGVCLVIAGLVYRTLEMPCQAALRGWFTPRHPVTTQA